MSPFLLQALLSSANLSAQPSVTVTLFDIAGLPPAVLKQAKTEAARILLQTGIRLVWVDCELAGQPVNLSACALPLSPARFMFQFIPGRNPANPRASGTATIQRGYSFFACLYPERIRDLSNDGKWDYADLLGRAVAHELGHLLMDSSGHSMAGVMRARWETEDLRMLSHHGLVFLPKQLDEARARLMMSAATPHAMMRATNRR